MTSQERGRVICLGSGRMSLIVSVLSARGLARLPPKRGNSRPWAQNAAGFWGDGARPYFARPGYPGGVFPSAATSNETTYSPLVVFTYSVFSSGSA
jgi:hypothetical protein